MTTPAPSPVHDVDAEVRDNRPCGGGCHSLSLQAPAIASAARPGQFVMLRFPGCLDPLLPRPMSVADVSPDGRIEILHKVVGKGTARLAALRAGDRLGVLGPLGKPFTVTPAPQPSARALMVAGGIGIAIFPFLVPALKRAGWRATLLFGARAAADLVERDRFAAAGVEVLTATEDGSHGRRGLVTTLLDEILASPSAAGVAYACGPTPMLRAVAQRVVAAGLPTQLSLEAAMGCGIGACLGCVVKVARPGGPAYARICQEGPTFEAAEVRWE